MTLAETPATRIQTRLTNSPDCLLAITDSLSATGQIVARLNVAISDPHCTLDEVATILRRDVMLSARVVRTANSAFFVGSRGPCKTIEEALQRVGLREVARLVAIATMQGLAPTQLRAYGISGEQFYRSVLFAASASQLIASEVRLDPNLAYLAGLMRPLGILVLNRWAEQNVAKVESLTWGEAVSLLDWERGNFGIHHVDVSSHVIRRWGFAGPVCEAIDRAGDSSTATADSPLALVLQTAEALAERNRATFHSSLRETALDKERLDALGLKPVQLLHIGREALNLSRSMPR